MRCTSPTIRPLKNKRCEASDISFSPSLPKNKTSLTRYFTMALPLLKVENLKKTYGGKAVVDGLSFEIKPGEVVGLLGPNGAGKTTAFYMTMGLIHPDDGKVLFKGHDATSLPIHKRAQLGMGYLAQEPSI